MKAFTKAEQDSITPAEALNKLVSGNKRFTEKKALNRDFTFQVSDTSSGQFPFAAVLSCIDSRVPTEIVFDQGIGGLFSARVAGNIVNEDILGSLEYACKIAGSKLIVVLGHTKCGAVTAACNNVELGNITALLSKIKPAIDEDVEMNETVIEEVALKNVQLSLDTIRKQSTILLQMESNGLIKMIGAMYDVSTGKVSIL
jgi:carbonic anhydrase